MGKSLVMGDTMTVTEMTMLEMGVMLLEMEGVLLRTEKMLLGTKGILTGTEGMPSGTIAMLPTRMSATGRMAIATLDGRVTPPDLTRVRTLAMVMEDTTRVLVHERTIHRDASKVTILTITITTTFTLPSPSPSLTNNSTMRIHPMGSISPLPHPRPTSRSIPACHRYRPTPPRRPSRRIGNTRARATRGSSWSARRRWIGSFMPSPWVNGSIPPR